MYRTRNPRKWIMPLFLVSRARAATCTSTSLAKWGGCPYLHLYQEGPVGWSTLGGLYVIAWSTLVKNQESLCGIWNQSGPRFHCTGYRYFQSVPSKVYPPNLPYFSIFTKPFPSVPSSSIVLLRNNIFAFFQFFISCYFIPVCVRCFQHRFF